MQKKRLWLSLVIAAAAAAAAPMASAAGFGTAPSAAVMGQSLDFAVPVRLEQGESLAADCVSADVVVGDRRLPAGQVRVTVSSSGDSARVQVATTAAIDEPMASVQITSTCATARLARRFTLFADPPLLASAAATTTAAPLVAAPAYAAAPPLVPAEAAPQAALPAGSEGGTAVLRALPPGRTGATASALPPTASRAAQPTLQAAATTNNRASTSRAERRAQAAARVAARSESQQAQQAPRRTRRTAAAQNTPKPAAAATPAVQVAQAAAPAAPAPRLKLEVAEPVINADAMIIDQALEAVAQAASAARAQASAASATAARIAALERTVDELRTEARGSRDMAAQLRDRLAQSDGGGRWMWPLFIVVLLLAVLASWLARKLAGVQRQRQADWMAATGELDDPAAPQAPRVSRLPGSAPSGLPADDTRPAGRQRTAPIPLVTAEVAASEFVTAPDTTPGRANAQPRPVQLRTSTAPAWPPAAPAAPDSLQPDWEPPSTVAASVQLQSPPNRAAADGGASVSGTTATQLESRRLAEAMQRTQPLPPSLRVPERTPDPTPRDVSIEELIDLEQQAEFFVVLGQDDAAIDLLVEHLRNTGGGSPLPYLKLLEIYRRRGDRADYERMRTRFNHRFNAYAPEWGVDLQAGRTLEDYTGVIPRLQQVWTRPLDAMAELEALLFRKSRGELFDLPAYREVLFLYSLARDLLDREASDTGNVDLLLPLADGGEFSSTAPAPFLGLDMGSGAHTDTNTPLPTLSLERSGFDDRPTAPIDLDLSMDVERTQSIFDVPDTQQLPPRPPATTRKR